MKGLYKDMFRRAAALGLAMGLTLTQVVVAADDGNVSKEETVYIFTDANGNQKKVLVDDWLKNAGTGEVQDSTVLQGIQNVKGDETFTENGDGTITWNADGKDIYYQGETTEEVPISVKITYMLDGQEITPEELAGKSGKVTIRYEYTNNTAVEQKVGDKTETVQVPFAVMTGLLFADGHAKNVEVSSGKVIEQGNSTIVVGVCLPGMQDSLKMDSYKDLTFEKEIPDYVEVTMDAEDFQLNMSMSVALNDLFDGTQTDKIQDKFEEAESEMDLLEESAGKLVDGSQELADGVGELADKVPELVDGTKELASGVTKYTDGVSKVKDGTDQLKSGSGELASGADTLDTGAKKLAAGADSAASGAKQVADGAGQLQTGAGTLSNGINQLDSGAGQLKSGAASAKSGADQLKTGADSLKNGAASAKSGSAQLKTGADSLKSGAASAKGGADRLNAGLSSAKAGSEKVKEGAGQLAAAAKQGADAYSEQMTGLKKNLGEKAAQLQKLKSGIDSTDAQNPGAIIKVNGAIDQINAGLAKIEATADYDGGSGQENKASLGSYLEEAKKAVAAAYDDLGLGQITEMPATVSEAKPQSQSSADAQTGSASEKKGASAVDTSAIDTLKEAAETAKAAAESKRDEVVASAASAGESLSGARSSVENAASSQNAADGAASAASSSFDSMYNSYAPLAALASKTPFGEQASGALSSASEVKGSYESAISSYQGAASSYAAAASAYESVVGSYEGVESEVTNLSSSYDQALADYQALAAEYQQQIEALKAENEALRNQQSNVSVQTEEAPAAENRNAANTMEEKVALATSLQNAYSKLTIAQYILDSESVNGAYLQGIAAKLSQGDAQQKAQAEELNKLVESGNGYAQGVAQIKAALSQLQAGLTGVDEKNPENSGVLQLSSGALGQVLTLLTDTSEDGLNAKLDKVGTSLDALAQGAADLSVGAGSLDTGLDQLSTGAGDLSTGLGTLSAGATQLATGATSLDTGLGTLSAGATQLATGATSLDTGLGTLSVGMNSLAGGITKMKNSAPTLVNGVNALATGAKSLSAGNTQLASGAKTLAGGTSKLAAGARKLDNGVGTLASGVNELNANSGALNDGAGKLAGGADTLADGVGKLNDGATELAEGMQKFNDEGIQKLMDLYKGDMSDLVNRLDAVVKAGQDYSSFAGLTDGMDGRVKFIIRTDSIKKDE